MLGRAILIWKEDGRRPWRRNLILVTNFGDVHWTDDIDHVPPPPFDPSSQIESTGAVITGHISIAVVYWASCFSFRNANHNLVACLDLGGEQMKTVLAVATVI